MRLSPPNPYQPPAEAAPGILEVVWIPFYALASGPVVGGALLLFTLGSRGLEGGGMLLVVGSALVSLGWLARRRQRRLVVDTEARAHVVRGEVAGTPFDRSALRRIEHASWLTGLYALLALGFANASLKACNAYPPLRPGPSPGEVAERLTAGGVGPFVAVLFGVAIWRRLTCARIEVPGERRSLWVRKDDLPQLGLSDQGAPPVSARR
ncbi:hypothetical protein QHF83_47670 [Polyangium sp. 15x6]|nr:hypothetical protein [Polyangium sp. 15x6]